MRTSSFRSDGINQDLDLLSLRLFARLCEERNLAKVGQKFGLMPSAISKRMSRLESELHGTPLFKRLRHGLEPTVAGLTFLKHVQGLLENLDKAADEMRGFTAGRTGQIRMLASESSLSTFLTADLHGFLSQPAHSNVALHLHSDSGNDVVQLLNDEIYNLGVMWNVQDTGNLISLPYRSDHLCAVVPQTHPLATLNSVGLIELADYDMVSVQSVARAESRVRRMKPKGELPTFRIRLVLPSIMNVLDSVRAGLGVGFAPQDAQNQLPNTEGLVFIPLLDGWAKRHFIVCYKDNERTPAAAKRLAHFLSEQATKSSQSNGI